MLHANMTVNSEVNAVNTVLLCPPGKCATTIVNGEKVCPQDDSQSVAFNPEIQVCNSKFVCDSRETPFALQPDGSTDEFGRCAPGDLCRCLNRAQCPSWSLSTFVASGSAYTEDTANSRLTYYQAPVQAQGVNQTVTYDNPNTESCSMKPYHLDRLSPGACAFAKPSDPTRAEVFTCINRNPCVVGVLAFAPDDVENFSVHPDDFAKMVATPVSCVPGRTQNACATNQVPVWDPMSGTVVCFNV